MPKKKTTKKKEVPAVEVVAGEELIANQAVVVKDEVATAAVEKTEELSPTVDNPVDNPETVTIAKKDFETMMETLEKQSKDIDLLMKASDKSRLQKAKGDDPEVLIHQATLKTWDDTGNIIIAWKLITNKCEVVMGKWIEDQSVVIVFEDGKTKTVSLLEFYRRTLIKVTGDIVSTTTELDENENKINLITLELESGKKITVNSSFLN